MNLAGVERVLELEEEMRADAPSGWRALEREAERMERRCAPRSTRVRRSFRFELVPYEPPGSALVPRDQRGVQIPISESSRSLARS